MTTQKVFSPSLVPLNHPKTKANIMASARVIVRVTMSSETSHSNISSPPLSVYDFKRPYWAKPLSSQAKWEARKCSRLNIDAVVVEGPFGDILCC